MGIISGFIIIFVFITIISTKNILYEILKVNYDKLAIAITQNLSNRSIDFILTGDFVKLKELFQETKDFHEEIEYIMLLNKNNQVVIHILPQDPSDELLKANYVFYSNKEHCEIFSSEIGLIKDIAFPVLEGRLGTLRIGFKENYLHKDIKKIINRVGVSILAASLLSMIVAYVLVTIINKPIQDLTKVAKAIKDGDINKRARVWSSDEVGKLSEAFNIMVDNLYETNQELKKMADTLREQENTRLQLVNKLINAYEEERKRISRELHDKISQSLTSIKMGLKSLQSLSKDSEDMEKIEKFKIMLNISLEEIHELCVDLRPSLLDDFGFFAAVREYIKNFEKGFNIKVNCKLKGFSEYERFNPLAEINVYRVIQEALSNIEKHASATEVNITFEKVDSYLVAVVKDNGCGFNIDEKLKSVNGRKPLGIFGMQERISLLGGIFKIKSAPQNGTEIFIKVSLC